MMMGEQIEIAAAARNFLNEFGGTLASILIPRGIVWNSDKGKFTVNGRAVSITTIRKQLTVIEKKMGTKVDDLTNDLEAGTIHVRQWQAEMKRIIGASHVLSAALALGSISTAVADTDVQNRISAEWRYLDEFVVEIKRGT